MTKKINTYKVWKRTFSLFCVFCFLVNSFFIFKLEAKSQSNSKEIEINDYKLNNKKLYAIAQNSIYIFSSSEEEGYSLTNSYKLKDVFNKIEIVSSGEEEYIILYSENSLSSSIHKLNVEDDLYSEILSLKGIGLDSIFLKDLNNDGLLDCIVKDSHSNSIYLNSDGFSFRKDISGDFDETAKTLTQETNKSKVIFPVKFVYENGESGLLKMKGKFLTQSTSIASMTSNYELTSTIRNSILQTNCNLMLSPATSLTNSQSPLMLTSADVNNDLIADIISTHANGTVLVRLGMNNGSFQDLSFTVADGVKNIAAGYVDNDTNIDLIVVHGTLPKFSIYKGNGNGTFTFDKQLSIPSGSYFSESGDLDKDNKIDLILSEYLSSSTKNIYIFLSSQSYLNPIKYDTGVLIGNLATGDFNGDGWLDIVAVNGYINSQNTQSNTLSFLQNNGNGTFSVSGSYTIPNFSPSSIAVSNLNDDNKADIVLTRYSYSTNRDIAVILSSTYGYLTNYYNFGQGTCSGATKLAIGDINSDGANDIVIGSYKFSNNNNYLSVLTNKGDGTLNTVTNTNLYNSSYLTPIGITLNDFNGDKKLDISTLYYNNDTVVIFNQGNCTPLESSSSSSSGSPGCQIGEILCSNSCTPGNCCENSQCPSSQTCINNNCSCPLGQILCNGICKEGNCCNDSQCPTNQLCIQNYCPVSAHTCKVESNLFMTLDGGCKQLSKNLIWDNIAPQNLNYNDANSYCESRDINGYNDWRLPTKVELRDAGTSGSPATHFNFDVGDDYKRFWSTSIYTGSTKAVISLFTGFEGGSDNNTKNPVVCVRYENNSSSSGNTISSSSSSSGSTTSSSGNITSTSSSSSGSTSTSSSSSSSSSSGNSTSTSSSSSGSTSSSSGNTSSVPSVNNISPSSVPKDINTQITITGSNLTNVSRVTFSNYEATILQKTGSQIFVLTPNVNNAFNATLILYDLNNNQYITGKSFSFTDGSSTSSSTTSSSSSSGSLTSSSSGNTTSTSSSSGTSLTGSSSSGLSSTTSSSGTTCAQNQILCNNTCKLGNCCTNAQCQSNQICSNNSCINSSGQFCYVDRIYIKNLNITPAQRTEIEQAFRGFSIFGGKTIGGDFNNDMISDFAAIYSGSFESYGERQSALCASSYIAGQGGEISHVNSNCSPINLNIGPFISSIEEGDLNLDNLSDIVIGTPNNDKGGKIHLFKTIANGSRTITTTLDGPSYGLIGDVNNDGENDVIGVHEIDKKISTYFRKKGEYDFDFSNAPVITTLPESNPLIFYGGGALGKLNNDSYLDLIFTNADPTQNLNNKVSILYGKGDGTFQAPIVFTTTPSLISRSVHIEDINRDGRNDFLVFGEDIEPNYDNPPIHPNNGVTVFLATSTSYIKLPVLYIKNAPEITVANFNNDLFPDILFTNPGANGLSDLSICYGKGNGTFMPPNKISNNNYGIYLKVLKNKKEIAYSGGIILDSGSCATPPPINTSSSGSTTTSSGSISSTSSSGAPTIIIPNPVFNIDARNIDGNGNSADNNDLSYEWKDLTPGSNLKATLKGFDLPFDGNSGWTGNNSSDDQSRIKLDFVDDGILLGNSSDVPLNGDYALSLWVNLYDINGTLFNDKQSVLKNTFGRIFLDKVHKILRFTISNDSDPGIQGKTQLKTNTWYHILVTKGKELGTDTPKFFLYLNGQPEGSRSYYGYYNPPLNSIGTRWLGGAGSIANFKIYNTHLDANQVKAIYDTDANYFSKSPPPPPSFTGGVPEITKISPEYGPTDGGNEVIITGRNLDRITQLTFGSKQATVTSRSSSEIKTIAPALETGFTSGSQAIVKAANSYGWSGQYYTGTYKAVSYSYINLATCSGTMAICSSGQIAVCDRSRIPPAVCVNNNTLCLDRDNSLFNTKVFCLPNGYNKEIPFTKLSADLQPTHNCKSTFLSTQGGCKDPISGLVWDNISLDKLTYREAREYCKERISQRTVFISGVSQVLTTDDWRLPSRDEINTIKGRVNNIFNFNTNNYFWTSTNFPQSAPPATYYSVNISNGAEAITDENVKNYIFCVRGKKN